MEEGEQRRGEEMGLTVKQRQAVMNELRGQYLHTPPNEKSRILDGFVDLTHLNRSYARSTLRARTMQETGPVHRHRASVYKGAVLPALTEFWHLSDRLCGKRLVPSPGHPFGVRERVHEQPPRSATLSTSTSPWHGHVRTGRMTTDQWSRRTGASSAGRSGTPGMTPRRKSCS